MNIFTFLSKKKQNPIWKILGPILNIVQTGLCGNILLATCLTLYCVRLPLIICIKHDYQYPTYIYWYVFKLPAVWLTESAQLRTQKPIMTLIKSLVHVCGCTQIAANYCQFVYCTKTLKNLICFDSKTKIWPFWK